MGPQKTENQEEMRKWVVAHNPYDNSRLKYYVKLGIELPDVPSEPDPVPQKQDIQLDIENVSPPDVRSRYLDRLGILNMEPQKECQHLIIFDWDDTLLCTSYLNSTKFRVSEEARQMLQRLDTCVVKLLTSVLKCKKDQNLIIVTNGAKGWVESSSTLYLPNTNTFFEEEKIPIVSARHLFGQEYPEEYGKWKMEAFKQLISDFKLNRSIVTNLLCIGDSMLEMDAATNLNNQFQKIVIKTIKLRSCPRPNELIKQLELLDSRIDEIINNAKTLTIKMQKK